MLSIKLSKLGYGTVPEIETMPADIVLDILEYERFIQDYESAYVELNKEK